MHKIAYKIIVAFGLRGLGALSGLILSLVITRTLSVEHAGQVFFCLTFVTVMVVFFGQGYQEAVQRFISSYISESQCFKVNNIYRTAMQKTSFSGIVGTVLMSLLGGGLCLGSNNELGVLLIFSSPCVFFGTLLALQAKAFQAISSPKLAIFFINIAVPFTFSILVLIAGFKIVGSIVIAYTVSLMVVSIFSIVLWWGLPWVKLGYYGSEELKKSAEELWVITVSRLIANWGTHFIAGFFVMSDAFAHLAVAQRLAMLISFVLIAANVVVAPKFAALWSKGDKRAFTQLAKDSTFVISIISFIFLVIGIYYANFFLSIFGKSYQESSSLFEILLFGQFVNAVCGSVTNVLIMSGHESAVKRVTLIFSVIAVILSLILIPNYGVYAAVWVATTVMAVQNIVMLFVVKKLLGFWMVGSPKSLLNVNKY